MALFQTEWYDNSVLSILFSWKVIIRFISFLLTAGAFTGAALLFKFFYWEGGMQGLDEEYRSFVRKLSINLVAITSIIIPVFLFINVAGFPENILTSGVFAYVIIALLLLFLGIIIYI